MADVRALLRHQRATRRVEHPHAAYSDAGKLLCVVCHEHIKTEALWDGHVRGTTHRERLQVLQQKAAARTNGPSESAETASKNGGAQSNKRKLDEDEEMTDQIADEESVRKKRSRPDITLGGDQANKKDKGENKTAAAAGGSTTKPLTPPLTRRQSGTPTIGVEMQIPSRPATPVAIRENGSNPNSVSGTSTVTTPRAMPMGRSPLIPQEPVSAQLPPQTGSTAQQKAGTTGTAASSSAPPDDLWAAFEADLIHSSSSSNKPLAVAGFVDSDAVISAPAMTAAEIAAKSQEEEREKRRALVDIQIEDEREDATRALETEFELMEELEARARKLRERREALRVQPGAGVASSGAVASTVSVELSKTAAPGKENAAAGVENEDDDDDEDDELEDDWVGFRFRA